jgi:hypothetical protein
MARYGRADGEAETLRASVLPVVAIASPSSPGLEARGLFEELVARVIVLHELKKTGALTYEEFAVLKGRLLGL